MKGKAHPISRSRIEEAAIDWIVRRDDGLTAAEAAEFERWQAADTRHAEAVARHERTWTMLDRPRAGGRSREMAAALSVRSACSAASP